MTDEFSAALRRLMTERGMSLRELARRAHYDPGYLSKVASGRKPVTPKVAAAADAALSAGGELAALARARRRPRGSPDTGRRSVLAGGVLAGGVLAGGMLSIGPEAGDRLAWAARNPPRVDAAAVDVLAGVLAAQRRAEDVLGSAALLKPVTAQLGAVEDLAAEARGPVRPAVVGIAQQWTQFAAWLHQSVRDIPAARALWRQTMELAAEAGDATMTATVLRFRGEMAWLAGKPGPMIGLAEAAQRDRRAAVSQRAFSAALEARGHAMTGDAQAAERKLGEAAELGGQLGAEPAEPWSYWYSPGWLECQRGIALGYLAHIERYRTQAIEAMASAETCDSAAELTAGYVVHRAAIHARGGDPGEACADWVKAAAVARRMDSARLGAMLAGLHADLEARYPDDPRVAELAEALR
jgi:hypothetical protein